MTLAHIDKVVEQAEARMQRLGVVPVNLHVGPEEYSELLADAMHRGLDLDDYTFRGLSVIVESGLYGAVRVCSERGTRRVIESLDAQGKEVWT